jgi:hypothetical protein
MKLAPHLFLRGFATQKQVWGLAFSCESAIINKELESVVDQPLVGAVCHGSRPTCFGACWAVFS